MLNATIIIVIIIIIIIHSTYRDVECQNFYCYYPQLLFPLLYPKSLLYRKLLFTAPTEILNVKSSLRY